MENTTQLLLILILVLQVISLLVLLNKKSVRQPEIALKKDDRKEDVPKNSVDKIRDSEKQQEQIRRTYDDSVNRNRDKDRDRHHNRDREQNRDPNREQNRDPNRDPNRDRNRDRNDRNDRNGRDRDRNRDNRGNNGGRFNNDRRPNPNQAPSVAPAAVVESAAVSTPVESQPQVAETSPQIDTSAAKSDDFQHGRRAFVKRRNLAGEVEAQTLETVEAAASAPVSSESATKVE